MTPPSATRTRKRAAKGPPVDLPNSPEDGERSLLDPIITMNLAGIIQSASTSVERVFGWTPEELAGRNIKTLIPEPRRSDLDRYLDRYRKASTSKPLQRASRFDAVRKDGSLIEIELSMARAELAANSPPFFIGIVRDVTHRIDRGPSTAKAHLLLRREIAEQTMALATANLRLQLADRLASLGTLAAGLGHDINNVLLPVRARLDAMEHAGISDGAVPHLNSVRRSISYLQHLSEGLHFLAMDPDGPGVAAEGEGVTNLHRWWGQVGSLLRKAVPRHVMVRASFSEELPDVRIAPHWLTQGVLNLIVNAGEALPPPRKQARVRVWAVVTEDGRTVRLSVNDNGLGMTPAVKRRALELFFTTKPRGIGTGLGLPLAQKVAVRAGGTIEIDSQQGKGTTVVLLLPVANGKDVRRLYAAAETRRAAVSARDPRTKALIIHVLVKAGVTLTTTKDMGPGASDIWVTEPDALALAAATRWRKRRPRRRVVLLGAPAKASQRAWAALDAVIIEPVDDLQVIRHTLGQVLLSG